MQHQIAKPFTIDKHVIMAAWKRVRENKGSAGIDNVSISDYETNLGTHLYKLWNRMSSGSYFPNWKKSFIQIRMVIVQIEVPMMQ